MADKPVENGKGSQSITWSDAVHFIWQLTHDLRNDLNAIELQSAYIEELGKSEEVKNEIKRLREMVSRLASTLQRLSRAVGEVKPNLIPYPACDFMQDLRGKIDHDFPKESKEKPHSCGLIHGGSLPSACLFCSGQPPQPSA